MRKEEREALRLLYQFRCGYCGVDETAVGAELTVDHFQPQLRGGADNALNWVYCCHACNEFKSDYWQPDSVRRLLHPLKDNLAAHITELEDGTLQAKSETGAFHIDWLHLNRQQLVAHRRERRLLAATQRVHAELLRDAKLLEKRITSLMDELARIRNDSSNK